MFVAAYVMRNSRTTLKMVMIYQLAVYTGIPLTFLINGCLLQLVRSSGFIPLGMFLSGVSMAVMMSLGKLSLVGMGTAGLLMGMSFGLYWANRDFLALSTTSDDNRNYYYGLETFFLHQHRHRRAVVVGWFIGGSEVEVGYMAKRNWHIRASRAWSSC